MRQFGSTELRASEFGLGCARIGGFFQGNVADVTALLSLARDSGINFFDTADMYSQGESEQLLGRAFKGQRHEVIIASKVGYRLPAQRRLAARLKPLLRPLVQTLRIRRAQVPPSVRGELAQEFSPNYLRRSVEMSLRRLRTDYLDLLQLHSPPAGVIERGEWEPALERMKRDGKIRYYGVASTGVEAGLAALSFSGVSSLQFTLNLLDYVALEKLVPEARRQRLGLVARECLANGLLVKPARDIDLRQYCDSPEDEAKRAQQLDVLRLELGSDPDALARRAIEYVHGTEGVSVTLLGVRSTAQLRDLLKKLPS
jgi:aryl-alcohol dehydrogenase-like predicted oxidoreductase